MKVEQLKQDIVIKTRSPVHSDPPLCSHSEKHRDSGQVFRPDSKGFILFLPIVRDLNSELCEIVLAFIDNTAAKPVESGVF